MNHQELISIFSNLKPRISPKTKFIHEYKNVSESFVLGALKNLDLLNATFYEENQTHIIETKKLYIRFKMVNDMIDHIWIKNPSPKQRYRIDVSYDGSFYEGSQKQSKTNQTNQTIQSVLEKVLEHLFQENVQIHLASRTDKGVHAYQNVAHFDASRNVETTDYIKLIERMLPEDIKVNLFIKTSSFFHARFDVDFKIYVYKFTYHNDLMNINKKKKIDPVNLPLIKEKAHLFQGTHDFKNYCKNRDYDSTTKTILKVDISETQDGFDIIIKGKGFLRHMVRMIAGAIIKQDVYTINEALSNPNKMVGKHKLDAHALYLKEIKY
jgi:tRNA pseudouridine38-40 synthase